jgi:hypothetical protein
VVVQEASKLILATSLKVCDTTAIAYTCCIVAFKSSDITPVSSRECYSQQRAMLCCCSLVRSTLNGMINEQYVSI